MTALFRVEVHLEMSSSDSREITWWADSPDLDNWTANAQTLESLKELVREGIEFFAESDDFSIAYTMDQSPQPSNGPEEFEIINREPQTTPSSKGILASTLVTA